MENNNVTDLNSTGSRIRALIKKNGIKQVEVCRAIGLSPSRLSNYLSNSREPDIDTLSKIARFLKVRLCAFDTTVDVLTETTCELCGAKHFEINPEIKDMFIKDQEQEEHAVGV